MKSNNMSESNIFAYNIIAQLRPFSIVQLIIYLKLATFFVIYILLCFYSIGKARIHHFLSRQNNCSENDLLLLTHMVYPFFN